MFHHFFDRAEISPSRSRNPIRGLHWETNAEKMDILDYAEKFFHQYEACACFFSSGTERRLAKQRPNAAGV